VPRQFPADGFFQPIVKCVTDNREQPRAGVFPAKTSKKLERAQTRFLHHILRIVVVAREPASKIASRIQMLQHRLFKQAYSFTFFHRNYFRPCRQLARPLFRMFYSQIIVCFHGTMAEEGRRCKKSDHPDSGRSITMETREWAIMDITGALAMSSDGRGIDLAKKI
jgi:hypothetical protein